MRSAKPMMESKTTRDARATTTNDNTRDATPSYKMIQQHQKTWHQK
eukprot:CAMPEP_0114018834 /NCGR_PEP_ID=MMETSP0372-20130328/15990_1 /TAXON_ID=340204 /ORGANISM="Lankesteria abbotti" /LENGTH=45 /assembly_acc=CAM_ASM_000359